MENTGSWGPWIVALVALGQFWVDKLIKWLWKPNVELYESGNVQVGYSDLGPTIAIAGTLRVSHGEAFITRIKLRLRRVRDNSSHEFGWRAFRPTGFPVGPPAPQIFEMASSFLLTASAPFKYNIIFVEDGFIAEVGPKLTKVGMEWHKHKQAAVLALAKKNGQTPRDLESPEFIANLFDEFAKQEVYMKPYTAISRACYWEAGRYVLEVIIERKGNGVWLSRSFSFRLSEEDAEGLRVNSIPILYFLCGLPNVAFHFANPQYETV